MNKNLSITALLGMVAIVLGAFAAHALKESLEPDQMEGLKTGIRYQMYHVIVLLFVNTYSGFTNKFKNQVSSLFFIGILFFSGSIYALYLLKISASSIWFITPLGGLILILGWVLLFIHFLKKASSKG